jgi:tRNA (guanine37-N1)-methyltransferase
MKIALLSVLPAMFQALDHGIVGRAQKNNLLSISHYPIFDYSQNKHRRIDDKSYGGGPGMVIGAPALSAATQAAKTALGAEAKVAYLSPCGTPLSSQACQTLAKRENMILVCGRYEGLDQRYIDDCVDEQWSVGDYVVSGGELPAMLLIDAITRFLPGALGDAESALQDSFTDTLLDHPHYTRPENFSSKMVPDVLLSGNHEKIAEWRHKQALGLTWLNRPDLLKRCDLSAKQVSLLAAFISEYEH